MLSSDNESGDVRDVSDKIRADFVRDFRKLRKSNGARDGSGSAPDQLWFYFKRNPSHLVNIK